MTMNLIVMGVTLLIGAFVVVWLSSARVRSWGELPKHRFLETERRFVAAHGKRRPPSGNEGFPG
jgi:hypothetical protein